MDEWNTNESFRRESREKKPKIWRGLARTQGKRFSQCGIDVFHQMSFNVRIYERNFPRKVWERLKTYNLKRPDRLGSRSQGHQHWPK